MGAGEIAVNRLHGQISTPPVRLAVARVHVPLSAVVAAWLAAALGWLVRHPLGLLLLGAGWLLNRVVARVGWWPFPILVLTAVAVLLRWRVLAAESFTARATRGPGAGGGAAGCTGSAGSRRWSPPAWRSPSGGASTCRGC